MTCDKASSRLSLAAAAALLVIAPAIGCAAEALATRLAVSPPLPEWAFAVNPPLDPAAPPLPAAAEDVTPRQVPGSSRAYTTSQTTDYFNPPDWHPDAHPSMPEIVAHGRPPQVIACGYCHLPNGQGRPENSSLAGLPAGYIAQQVSDFRTGKRIGSEPRHLPTAYMVTRETQATEQEVLAAAQYFASLTPTRWVRVVETDTVPVTRIAGWMHVPTRPAHVEPIGQNIIEMAEDLERTELRDDASGFVAYAPRGSLAKGKLLVETGGANRTIQCNLCHGPDLRGVVIAPSIAGRSPSYIMRQLYDMQRGSRAGEGAALMAPVVAKLTLGEMLAIAAYTASLEP